MDCFKKNLDDVILEFCINGISASDDSWMDVDIKISSSVISYNLRDWERDGEIFEKYDMLMVTKIINRWLDNSLENVEEYETTEPDLLLRFYPDVDEKRIDFCICLQTEDLAFTDNYIILPLVGQDAEEFVAYFNNAKATYLI